MLYLFKILISLILAIFFTACSSTVSNNLDVRTSYIQKEIILTNDNNKKLTKDLTDFIKTHYHPSKTIFYFDSSNKNSALYKEINKNLQKDGYGISNINDNSYKYLSYQISNFDKYLRATYNIDTSKLNLFYLKEDNELILFSKSGINIKQRINSFDFEKETIKKEIVKAKEEPLTGIVKARVLRIRSNPSIKSKVIGRLRKGNLVEIDYITETKNYKWAKLLNNDGYISNKYIAY